MTYHPTHEANDDECSCSSPDYGTALDCPIHGNLSRTGEPLKDTAAFAPDEANGAET